MKHWFTRRDAPVETTWVKRFDPLHWTVDFPRGPIASTITSADGHGLTVRCEFLRLGDLVGLIWASEDELAHPAHARETARDYSATRLTFRWRSSGVMPLDQIQGPTLTIEGKDALGNPRSWLVRIWNYAAGTPDDAIVTIDFDALDGGFSLPADADRVFPKAIERMFLSIVPPDYSPGSESVRPAPASASVEISGIACEGAGSVLAINDAVVPEHGLRIATAYDDMYNLPPERIVDSIERLGYRGIINHYVGMSHYFGLGGDARLDKARTLNAPALEWHRDLARAAKARGYKLIWSISYEVLAMFCPDDWKQRAHDGAEALTGWDPPSSLVSPANAEAIGFLSAVALQLVQLSVDAGLEPMVQVGEPWWWVNPGTRALCAYDDAAVAALGGAPAAITDVNAAMSAQQIALLDQLGELLAASTAEICAAVKTAAPDATTLLLAYLPTVLDPDAPDLKRANLPVGWARPAFDVLQLEDYDWVTAGQAARRAAAYAAVNQRLGYPADEQHYLSGFVLDAADRAQWREIVAAAGEARDRGIAEIFLWALPQVLRDGLTLFGEEEVDPFDDVVFPIAIGAEASVAPGFSTNVVTSASGREYRNVNWQQSRLRFDAGPGVRGEAEVEALLAFFRARRGAAVGFRFRDPYDFSSSGMTGVPAPGDQAIGVGDGAATGFALAKTYGTGEQRRITRPVAGTVRVAVGGTEAAGGWTLGEMGTIVFAAPPAAGAAITAGFLFDVPVRFAEDRLEITRATFNAGEAPSVPLVEIREA